MIVVLTPCGIEIEIKVCGIEHLVSAETNATTSSINANKAKRRKDLIAADYSLPFLGEGERGSAGVTLRNVDPTLYCLHDLGDGPFDPAPAILGL